MSARNSSIHAEDQAWVGQLPEHMAPSLLVNSVRPVKGEFCGNQMWCVCTVCTSVYVCVWRVCVQYIRVYSMYIVRVCVQYILVS